MWGLAKGRSARRLTDLQRSFWGSASPTPTRGALTLPLCLIRAALQKITLRCSPLIIVPLLLSLSILPPLWLDFALCDSSTIDKSCTQIFPTMSQFDLHPAPMEKAPTIPRLGGGSIFCNESFICVPKKKKKSSQNSFGLHP